MFFTSAGKPGRIGTVHIDLIESISAPRSYRRTDAAIESGAPVTAHRQREPFSLSVSIVIGDAGPLIGLWELHHAQKTRDAIRDLQARSTPVAFFDGVEHWINPSGAAAWIIDEIDDSREPGSEGIWRATIRLGELAQFTPQFTALAAGVDPSLADAADGAVDKGFQSPAPVPADMATEVF